MESHKQKELRSTTPHRRTDPVGIAVSADFFLLPCRSQHRSDVTGPVLNPPWVNIRVPALMCRGVSPLMGRSVEWR